MINYKIRKKIHSTGTNLYLSIKINHLEEKNKKNQRLFSHHCPTEISHRET